MYAVELSRFRLLERLGEDEMGVVFKAKEKSVDRDVAVRVLAAGKASDPERRRRLVWEAQAASALGHSNVLTVYEIGSDAGVDFVVNEYVPGRSLAEVIPGAGLPPRDALAYAVQIADALAAAHAAGVVHRGLMPASVLVTAAGLVKVLDFGLSNLADPIPFREEDETPPVGTHEKAARSRSAYMSPEQVQGRQADARSDVFSFGALLHEMVTGRNAFARDSRWATRAAVLRDEPEQARRPAVEVPPELERIIHRCLRKEPSERFPSMAAVKLALEEVRDGAGGGPSRATRLEPGQRTLIWAAACSLVVLAATAFWIAQPSPEKAEPPRPAPLMSFDGSIGSPCLSPDGRRVAFSWNGEKRDNVDIYVKPVGPGAPVRITTDPAADTSPTFSPDGMQIAFLRHRASDRTFVMVIPSAGGPERVVAERKIIRPGLTWSTDTRFLVLSERASHALPANLTRLTLATGETRPVTHPSPVYRAGDAVPSLSPDGRTLAFSRHVSGTTGEIWLLEVTKDLEAVGEPFPLTSEKRDAGGNAWTADGRSIVFSTDKVAGTSGSGLVVVPASPRGGAARRLVGGEGGESPTCSRTGNLVFIRRTRDENVWRLPLEGGLPGRPAPLLSSGRDDIEPRFSPDGKTVVFCSSRSGSNQVWLSAADGSRPVQLTRMDAGMTSAARFSPDGRRIAFVSDFVGDMEVFLTTPAGQDPVRLTFSPFHETAPSWSRDGMWVYFASNRQDGFQLWKTRPEPGSPLVRVTRNGGYAALESGDGKTLYYAKSGTTWSVWKVPTGGGEERLVLPRIANWGAFDVTATGLYYVTTAQRKHQVRRLRFSDGVDDLLATLDKPYTFGIAAAPDDSAVLFSQLDLSTSKLMLIERFE